MGLLWLILLILFQQCLCSVQEAVQTEPGNRTKIESCIGSYYELEQYVKGNTTLLETLEYAFFVTGRLPSEFGTITYNFQISGVQDNKAVNCSEHQSTYIWSQRYLYLLGPDSLYWSTLSAVNVPIFEVAINLPCLCHHTYEYLLSQLTERVMVATMYRYVHTYVHRYIASYIHPVHIYIHRGVGR